MLRFHEFSRTSRSTKTENLALLHKYAKNYNLFPGSIQLHETSHLGYLFKIIERVLSLLYACFIFPVFFLFFINFQRHMHSMCVCGI